MSPHHQHQQGWGCGGYSLFLFRGQNSVYDGVVSILYLRVQLHICLSVSLNNLEQKSPCVLPPFHRKLQLREIIAVPSHSVRGVMLTIWQSICHGTLCTPLLLYKLTMTASALLDSTSWHGFFWYVLYVWSISVTPSIFSYPSHVPKSVKTPRKNSSLLNVCVA